MLTTRRVVGPLRILLALAFAALVLAQVVVLPGTWRERAGEFPNSAYWGWPTLTVAVLGLLCVQVVIVCTWKLLTLVEDDRIFSEASLAWVNAIVGALGTAWVLLLGAFVHSVVRWDVPGLPAALLLVLVAVAVLGLLMVVMRALLKQATTLRTDMEAVI
ncbi:DUF2975 domain-containing protein [Geodermatophilus sp. DF01-2]|uniref:DUF2975 domain-containing protein n=1 Tax=Geodermatophilus sp. DF01-2 TaxID=2559610 RepID=UPI0010746E86|nr:DUF2975 domain-containing protein [Geodermatophilus sp. DF01_2]TFV62408.1 DUF2975 domain-containing protein [Geodermatophilus sp. DF01_2]